ncbi:hypothetical protein [Rhizobium alvei]|uniref:DUF4625 domain-containing protein n=1 Tax=Rhizobium alvei TaxID=1132659 RepID=A0ABT8YPU4_9HYPH|nr:hypothetical protein [Rhizobium alvei]MDO6965731.1 hypothetical protein [Rhizobium alvei]
MTHGIRGRTFAVIAASALVSIGMPVNASHAGTLVDLATEAEQLLDKGNGLEAYEKLRSSLSKASEKIPFDIRRAFFVTAKPVVFGNYDRVKENQFPVGSSLITYVEPVGLAWKPNDNGELFSQFTVDFELRNPTGEKLAVQKAFGNFKVESREPLFEIYTPLTLDVSSVPAGDYVLQYTFTDQNSGKTTSIEQKFTLK